MSRFLQEDCCLPFCWNIGWDLLDIDERQTNPFFRNIARSARNRIQYSIEEEEEISPRRDYTEFCNQPFYGDYPHFCARVMDVLPTDPRLFPIYQEVPPSHNPRLRRGCIISHILRIQQQLQILVDSGDCEYEQYPGGFKVTFVSGEEVHVKCMAINETGSFHCCIEKSAPGHHSVKIEILVNRLLTCRII